MSMEEDRTNRSTYIENYAASIDAASSVTFNMGSGTDSDTNKYLDLPETVAYGVEVIPTVACSITAINGRGLKAGISVGTGGYRTNNLKIYSLTITAGSATVVEVSAKGGQ